MRPHPLLDDGQIRSTLTEPEAGLLCGKTSETAPDACRWGLRYLALGSVDGSSVPSANRLSPARVEGGDPKRRVRRWRQESHAVPKDRNIPVTPRGCDLLEIICCLGIVGRSANKQQRQIERTRRRLSGRCRRQSNGYPISTTRPSTRRPRLFIRSRSTYKDTNTCRPPPGPDKRPLDVARSSQTIAGLGLADPRRGNTTNRV